MKYSRKGAKVLAFFQPEVRPFSLLISLDAAKFDLLSFLTLMETICPKMWSKSRRKNAKKKPLPVNVRLQKTSLVMLPLCFPVTS